MAALTPLPPSLRRGLVAFSGSLFINNKTWDSGTAHTYQPGMGRRVLQRGLGKRGFTVTLLSTPPKHLVPLRQQHPKGP